ncbi:carbamate kinase [Chromobacterium sphagni]|uniref:Carbamate kinase n=1 Tax=Chromobacterium sphagni TaxID=1903179 RepID=A0A1S1X033_9NEIS|nr:carbamate kinase [Chromobacterium sphagni]OHX12897.1 carbamate kinase [Chromobacterium sphagni]OHX19897.1 carbamate kinase [Chromobacterium sphagni]
MRVVVALGGNALQRRGEAMTADNQRANVKVAAEQLAAVTRLGHNLVMCHGNGPQVGLLGLQNDAYARHVDGKVTPYPLDVLGAQTEGMIGYMVEQELGNVLPFEVPIATILTQTEVDPNDPAFKNPTKFVGPVYGKDEAEKLAVEKGWVVKADGEYFRRVVPSPKPKRIFEMRPIKWLIEKGVVVIAAGGGGIPTMYQGDRLVGVEAVIDKDLASALLAREVDADYFVIATDVKSVFVGWGTPEAKAIRHAHPDEMDKLGFAAGSMGPKVEAACEFARLAGKKAVIGALEDIERIVKGEAGTVISTARPGIEWY